MRVTWKRKRPAMVTLPGTCSRTRSIGLALTALLVLAAPASAQQVEPPLRADELTVEVRAPLAASATATEDLLAVLARIEGEQGELAIEENPAIDRVEGTERRHIRALGTAIRRNGGTRAALAGKLLLAGIVARSRSRDDATRALVREVQRDFPGTWQAVVARMGEAALAAPRRSGPREAFGPAIDLARSAAEAAVAVPALDAADARLARACRIRVGLEGEALHHLASLQYASAMPDRTPAYDRRRLEEARGTLLQLRARCPEYEKAYPRQVEDFLATIETILGRERLE